MYPSESASRATCGSQGRPRTQWLRCRSSSACRRAIPMVPPHDTRRICSICCREHGIEHRFTKINHPWTNGQVERMNRTIKDATIKRSHYDDHNQVRQHLADFVDGSNFGRRLKTPFEFISKC
jgi:hypothetical protein